MVLVATAAAAAFAFYQIGERSFWQDEAASYYLAELDWPRLVEVTFTGQRGWHPPTYHLALKLWQIPFGTTEAGLRSFSALFAVLSIPALFVVVGQIASRWTAAAASLLLSLNAFLVEYAQEARTYTLTMFLAIVSYWLLITAARTGGAWRWAAYVAVAVAGMYSFVFFALVLAAQVLTLLLLGAPRINVRAPAMAWTAIGLLSLPAVVLAVARGSVVDWIPPITWDAIPLMFEAYAGGNAAAFTAYAVGALLGLAWLAGPGRGWKGTALILLWIAVPVGGLAAMSLIKPLFIHRYMIAALPAIVVLVALGISRAPTWTRLPVASVIIATSLLAIGDWYAAEHPQWRDVVRHLHREGTPQDALVLWNISDRMPMSYQVTQLRLTQGMPQRATPPHPWTWNQYKADPAPDIGSARRLRSCEYRRVWMVGGPADGSRHGNPDIAAVLGVAYEVRDTTVVGNVPIHRLTRSESPCV